MKEYISNSPRETGDIAKKFAGGLTTGDVVALFGPMGAGKTAFVRECAQVFGVMEDVSSPTFAIMNEYGTAPLIHHYDMYRISGWNDLYFTGFIEDIDDGNKIIFVEWSENIEQYLPKEAIRVEISYGGTEGSRVIKICEWDKSREAL